MRNLFQFQSMFPALAVIAIVLAVWLPASVDTARANPSLRGTSLAEPELAAASQSGDPHQLVAQGNPRHFVVICEAGCGPEQAIVGLTRRNPGVAAKEFAGVTPSETEHEAVCIGGCFDDAGPVADPAGFASSAVDWSATATGSGTTAHGPDQPAANTSGRWYDRIGNPGAR